MRPGTKTLLIPNMEPKLVIRLQKIADRQDRSLAATIRVALKEYAREQDRLFKLAEAEYEQQ